MIPIFYITLNNDVDLDLAKNSLPEGLNAILLFLPLFTCFRKESLSKSDAVARLLGSGSKQSKIKALVSADSDSGISG